MHARSVHLQGGVPEGCCFLQKKASNTLFFADMPLATGKQNAM
jgi:hypothetical protein